MTATQLLAFVRSCLQQPEQNSSIIKFHYLERLPQNVSRMVNMLNEDNLDSMVGMVARAMTHFDGAPVTPASNPFVIQRDTSTSPTPTTQTNKDQLV